MLPTPLPTLSEVLAFPVLSCAVTLHNKVDHSPLVRCQVHLADWSLGVGPLWALPSPRDGAGESEQFPPGWVCRWPLPLGLLGVVGSHEWTQLP